MSKHLGNVVEPNDVLANEGADATRWMFYAGSHPWVSVRFSEAAVNEMKRRFMGTFWNTYAFFVLYANIDGFEREAYDDFPVNDHKTVIDRWIESRLHSLIDEVDTKLEAYDITTAARALEAFTDDLSNWYVRRSRERFWGAGLDADKITAYIVLHDVLVTMAHLIAPFTPFMAEMVYQNLVVGHLEEARASVHLCDFPSVDETKIDRKLERDMERVLEIVSLGRAARNASQLKIRQPLAEMIVVGGEPLSDELTELVLDELNIKKMVREENDRRLVDYAFKPQLRTLGRLMGANLPKGRKLIEALPGRETMDRIENEGKYKLEVEGVVYELTIDDLLVEEVPASGFAVESAGAVTVALNTVLSEQLIEEGLVREMVSKIQTMRRSSDFQVTDRIELYVRRDALADVIDRYIDDIMEEVLAQQVIFFEDESELPDGISAQEWNINGNDMSFAVRVP